MVVKGELEAMKTIGLLGGMSWESTVTYYQSINTIVKNELGGFHSAKILLYSFDFEEIEACLSKEDWNKAADILAEAAVKLEHAGADFIVICTNTLHKVVPQIQERISIPIIHIAEATAEELTKNNLKKVALLGTKYTMKQDFYKDKLVAAGIDVLIPDDHDIELINHVIFGELCLGIISEKSKEEYLRIIAKLAEKGAQGVILGCTELGLLIKQEDTALTIFDTTQIHGTKAAMFAIGEKNTQEN
jgi:aspartate racemase